MNSVLMSKLGVGTVQFGMNYGISNSQGQTSNHEVSKIIQFCLENKIDTLDTAYAYGDSETILGENNIEEFKIITKYQSIRQCGISLNDQIRTSLERLNRKKIYALLSHDPENLIKNNEEWGKLNELKYSGIVEKIGVSFNHPNEINDAISKGIIPDIVQTPFNFFDDRFVENLLKLKNDYGTEIHTRSTYLQGLFFMNILEMDNFFEPVKKEIEILQKRYSPLSSYLLNYALSQKFIDKVIIGINDLKQLEESVEHLTKVDTIIDRSSFEIPEEILVPSKWPIRN